MILIKFCFLNGILPSVSTYNSEVVPKSNLTNIDIVQKLFNERIFYIKLQSIYVITKLYNYSVLLENGDPYKRGLIVWRKYNNSFYEYIV